MATQELITTTGKGAKKTQVELDPAVFEAPVRPHLFHAEVRRQLSRRQRGTHATKNRAGVSGGGVKPWRQKGTGRARQGSIRSPQWSGGGIVFGPVPRSHEHELPKKVRRAALRGALSLRRGEGKLTAVDALAVADAKTRQVVELLGRLGIDGAESVLIVIDQADPGLERAARNLRWAKVLRAEGLNTYDVLRHQRLVVTRAALDAIHARLGAAKAAEETGS
jgi:large subunit ribosomal protein L4